MHFLSFSHNDEVEINTWLKSQKPQWAPCLEEIVDNGWSLKVTPPGSRDDYTVSITCKDTASDAHDHSFILTYPDFDGAILLAYYVSTVMYDRAELDTYYAKSQGRFLSSIA